MYVCISHNRLHFAAVKKKCFQSLAAYATKGSVFADVICPLLVSIGRDSCPTHLRHRLIRTSFKWHIESLSVEPQKGATNCPSKLLRKATSTRTSLPKQNARPSQPVERRGNSILPQGRRENVVEQEYKISYSVQVKVDVITLSIII